ncbi:DHA2 family efflux MFS transporter permease subunit [Bacillus salacetis]|uniref:DHA2 family efflux MFS transporter permease subunit n=1 Tax=Bacillus salacetis TaxID=2315464 RepID=A0A3A1QMG6_9BACI|nr:MDR family MFS transporter [Bacillus salacetis]RIW28042.1 DHA2 family efflux MFS transporter permease subunit [Bacillus salacetis]
MVAKESNMNLALAGLLLGILMSAMDNTIVATALGSIVSDLGGLDKFVWVTSAYMVAVMAGMPIFGKLSDMYGRKRFFIFGLTIFLIGSALCGIAQDIVQLSIFRAIQGIGGGALLPIAFTIVFDIFPPEKRGKMTGILGAVFGSASVFGPLIGAFLTDNLSWHWVFYVNVPIGLLSLFFVVTAYKESPERSKERIDWGGAITLVAAVVSLMFALELGGNEFSWSSWQIIGLLASFLIFFISFFFIERKAAEPIISFWMFKSPLFASAQALAFLYGSAFIILTILIPIFVQSVYGGSATNAGLILTPLMLGSVAGSAAAGIRMTKNSYRGIMWVSIISFIIGMALLATMGPETSRWLLTLYMVISGFGVGFSFSLLPNATIHKLEPRFRGSANSTNAFFRSLGMTIGITVFGTLQTKFFSSNLASAFEGQSGGGFPTGDPRSLFEPEMREKIPAAVLEKITGAMSDSITATFAYALIPLVIALVFVYLMGSSRLEVAEKQKGK